LKRQNNQDKTPVGNAVSNKGGLQRANQNRDLKNAAATPRKCNWEHQEMHQVSRKSDIENLILFTILCSLKF